MRFLCHHHLSTQVLIKGLQLLVQTLTLQMDLSVVTWGQLRSLQSHSAGWEEGGSLKNRLCSEIDCWAYCDEISVVHVLENRRNMRKLYSCYMADVP